MPFGEGQRGPYGVNRAVAVAAAFLFSAASFASEIVSHTVKTNLRDYEQLTLFLMMPPEGRAEGVFCLSLLAKHQDDVRAQLKGTSKRRPVDRALDFARERRFAVVAWGARRLWDSTRNWDELPRSEANRIDARFDKVANAWNAGINFFVKKYGIPPSGYLMMGSSGAAQYAQRLALRRPERFLAVHAHIASSFDLPVKGGASLLWCVTTGENEMGYERSRRFFRAARDLSYPIIYKAYPGLGHEGSAKVTELGFTCFEFALEELARATRLNGGKFAKPDWANVFKSSEYVADVFNQSVYPKADAICVPPEFRMFLPAAIREAWIGE